MKRTYLATVVLFAALLSTQPGPLVNQVSKIVAAEEKLPATPPSAEPLSIAKSVNGFAIDAKFPGGNIVVDRIEGDTVWLRPDLRDTKGGWFYWCFRVQGAQGRTVKFEFTAQDPVGVRGSALSLDNGLTWSWLGKAQATSHSFVYHFPNDATCALFSMGMPYTQTNWDIFLKRLGKSAELRPGTLTTSRKGRAVESLLLGAASPKVNMLVTARHHACEMMASYELEGLVEAAVADDELGRWFRQNVQLLIIPFVDKDGVEEGDQGKNRSPHDHNRDYGVASLYPEVRAICQELTECSTSTPPMLVLDLHCPWITDQKIHQAGNKDPRIWSEQQHLAQILEKAAQGRLPYSASNDVPFGTSWNVAGNYAAGQSLGRWAATLPNVRLAATLELPYSTASGQEVNATTARGFGHDLAKALRLYAERDK